ncbi:MAG: T9SS type A sorting domain-containing protein, partial [Flavobacteriales bacterium]|nr:T9SS type A sorting domain-containing protein [Flavobacteriales bacterium]
VDYDPYMGLSFYRLKQTDFDGMFEYSEIRSVYLQENATPHFLLYPNPSNGLFNITWSENIMDETASLTIYNLILQKVYEIEIIIGSHMQVSQLNVAHLPSGMYFLQLGVGSELQRQQFIIEH